MPKPKIHSKTGKPYKVVHNDRPDEETPSTITTAKIFRSALERGYENGRKAVAMEVLEMIETVGSGREECVLRILELLEKELI